jgi:hypothetical protein
MRRAGTERGVHAGIGDDVSAHLTLPQKEGCYRAGQTTPLSSRNRGHLVEKELAGTKSNW